jgi:ATP-dependent protease ClpP protease subunit
MAKLHLYGSVGESFWGEESFTAKEVREQLAAINGPVDVYLNSGGGSATDGQAIYAILKAHPYRVTVIIEGCAASAASLIAMAGVEIVLTDGAWLLLHDPATPFTNGRGTPDDHAKTAQLLDQIAVAYAEIYARRSGNSVDDVRALMRAETLLVGDAAVQMGFADRVDREADAKAVAAFDYRIYATAPKAARRESERLGAFQGKEAVLAMIAGVAGAAMETKMNVRANPVNPDADNKTKIVMTAAEVTKVYAAAAAAGMAHDAVTAMIEGGKTAAMALEEINAWWVDQGGDQAPMLGRVTARFGTDHTSPQALAERQADAVAAKLAPHLGLKHEPTIGRDLMGASLLDMKVDQLAARGIKLRQPSEAIQMNSHTNDDFPLVIGGGLTAVVRRMAEQQDPAIARCARTIAADDYRAGNAVSLSGTGVPQKVNEAGELKFTTINDEGEAKAVPDDYGTIFRLSNKALVNDASALGLMADIARQMIKGAMELKRSTLVAPLLANAGAGQTMRDTLTLFHATHGNLAGAGTVISVTSISAARTAMRRQKDSNGIILNAEPRMILVPPELETVAQQVVAQITATKSADVNPFAGELQVVAEPGLTNATAWYLVADPAQVDGLAMAYLFGNEAPRIDAKEGWGTLGMEFRLVWSIGAAFHAYQSWFRNPGA